MMVFALAACGDNNTTDPDKDSPGVSQSGENNNGDEFSNWGDIFSNLGDWKVLPNSSKTASLKACLSNNRK